MFLYLEQFKELNRHYDKVLHAETVARSQHLAIANNYLDFMDKYIKSVHAYRLKVCNSLGQPRSALYFRLHRKRTRLSELPYVYPLLILVISQKRRASSASPNKKHVQWQVNRKLSNKQSHEYYKYIYDHEFPIFKYAIHHLDKFSLTYSALKARYDELPFAHQQISDLNTVPVSLDVG